jgi:type 1 fimbria pilin
VDNALSERYAPPPAWRRPVTIAAVVVVAAVALAWLAWAAFVESTPKVHSQLVGWQVVDAHSASAQVDVSISGGTTHATCTLQALASDHTIVGQLRFTPSDGTNQVTVRTSRTATSITLPGCIADGQDQPR